MKTIQLGRYIYSPNMGTFGWLDVDGWRCQTVEEIWKDNRRNISCVPVETYKLVRAIHRIGTPDPNDDYPCWQLVDVPGRSAINIHVLNTIRGTEGCIGVGERHGVVETHWAVLNSRKTFAQFMERMEILEQQDADLWITIGNVTADGGVLPT